MTSIESDPLESQSLFVRRKKIALVEIGSESAPDI
jgi:hypothetical protein